ncbi:MAG: rhtB 5 [Proteobacteria bacterium]|nr:rhtB 5 [Pseudomonadota bacterium]
MDFLPTAGVLAAYTLAVLALNYTPGPDMAMFVGTAITRGRRAGFSAFFGTSTGILVHTLLVTFGLAALLAASPVAFDLLKVIGALYLLYVAVSAIRHGSRFAPDDGVLPPEPAIRLYLKGLAINVLNPKVALFFLTFLPQFVEPGDPAARGKLLFLGLWFLVVSTLSMLPLILGASGVAAFLKARPTAMRAIDYVFAGVMGAFAVKLVTARL